MQQRQVITRVCICLLILTTAPASSSPVRAEPTLPAVVERASQLESATFGYGNTKSEVHAAFFQFARQTSTQDLARLLAHPNPVVRAYVGEYVYFERLEAASILHSVFADASKVLVMDGCSITTEPYARRLLRSLCRAARHERSRNEVHELLLAVAKEHLGDADIGGEALRCVAPYKPASAEPLCRAALHQKAPNARTMGAVALALTGADGSLVALAEHGFNSPLAARMRGEIEDAIVISATEKNLALLVEYLKKNPKVDAAPMLEILARHQVPSVRKFMKILRELPHPSRHIADKYLSD